MTRKLSHFVALAAVMGLAGCADQLVVSNPNSPDTKRVLGTPTDAENLLGSYYKRWHSGIYGGGSGSITNLEGMTGMLSLMNYSSLANNCLNGRTPFTGASNPNNPGNVCFGEQYRLYQYMSEVNRVASSYMGQVKGGLTLGSPARDARAVAFAEFLNGISLGYLAMFHDSAAVVSAETSPQDGGKLVGYKAVFDSSMAAFQRSIDATNKTVTGANGFPLPATWIPSPTVFTQVEFLKLVRSYRARIRANVARTPADRAAVDWTSVIADAQAGFTVDHQITTSTTAGPFGGWRTQYDAAGLWHQMPPFFIGMADTSGSYAAWIAQPLLQRGSGNTGFLMATPDLRFPQGATRAAQQADFAIASCEAASTPCKHYFVNRPAGSDQFAGAGFGWSNYDHTRFHSWNIAGDGSARNGNTPYFVKAEVDMLVAEGLYRKGDYAGAAALVNVTRVKNGLPAITAFDATSPVPGGSVNCIPKVPVAPYNVVGCGNLFEALKYEKRLETAYTSFSPWFLDGRGWGDLPKDTPLFWAVPYQDLQARGVATAAIYGAGVGPGNAPGSTAGTSVYGW